MTNQMRKPAQPGKKSLPPSSVQRINELPLPQTTRQLLPQMLSECENVGLLFDRYIFFGPNWNMSSSFNRQDTPKLSNLKQIKNRQDQLEDHWSRTLPAHAINRWHTTVESQRAIPFKMTPEWRFVVGLGDKTALEVGFTFHRIYGYPLIPGSSLKGLARAYALWEIASLLKVPKLSLSEVKTLANDKDKTPLQLLEDLLLANDERIQESKQRETAQKEEQKILEILRKKVGTKINLDLHHLLLNRFRQIFGTQYAAGEAIFFDAVPAGTPKLEIDIMNVHYPEYYQDQENKTSPADNQSPIPIPFLTVGQTPFWFAVGWRSKMDETGLDQARKWLEKGLTDFGVGAKTAAGYGYFYSAQEMA